LLRVLTLLRPAIVESATDFPLHNQWRFASNLVFLSYLQALGRRSSDV
jgi:hypothetical protein